MRRAWLLALALAALALAGCQQPESAFPGVSASGKEGERAQAPAARSQPDRSSRPAEGPADGAELRILFDGSHGQTAGAADWIVDADASELTFKTFTCRPGPRQHSAQRLPTPPQSQVAATTRETFWDGGLSAWGMALAQDALEPGKPRWRIEQYAWDAGAMTWGDRGNPQDLSHYAVLVLAEPNSPFTEAEAEAIRRFVREGGGLFLIADHETSDRDCTEGEEPLDSPAILNRLMGTKIRTRPTFPYWDPDDPTNDFGDFGIWFYENGNDSKNDRDNRRFDWFDEAVNRNVNDDPDDPILRGPFGDGSGGLGLFGATQLAVSTDSRRGNPTARAHVWRNGQSPSPRTSGVSERVTFASARYGKGRVVAIGDSSPADDGTGQGKLYPGWDKAKGGVANDRIFLNATAWLAGISPRAQ